MQVTPEFLRSQIEVGTTVCESIDNLRQDLIRLRRGVADVAERHGLAIISASTHPFAHWERQRHTDHERYNVLAEDMQGVVRRLLICGMHVHVGIDDNELRIDLMNQISYFLPHLLALTTSSPFWQGIDTGLKSYRLTVWDALPRTGLPEHFDSWAEFNRHVAVLAEAGIIEDASKIWWDVRPSVRYPTLEMRIADSCTLLEDTLTVAAIYLCLLRMLFRRRIENQRWREYSNMLVTENRWRAQRYGLSGGLMDFGKGELVPYPDLLEEILELIADDAAHFGVVEEVERARHIVATGTSADRQLEVYQKQLAGGADERKALQSVVDMLVEDTVAGI